MGYFVFRVGKEASLKKLLIASTVVLLFIAAGLFSHGVHELQELEVFGTWDGDRNHMVSSRYSCGGMTQNCPFRCEALASVV